MPGMIDNRPTLVTLLIAAMGLAGLVAFLGGVGQLTLTRGASGGVAGRSEAIAVLLFVVGVALAASAWGTFAQHGWAWTLGLLSGGVSVLVAIFGLYLADVTTSLLLLILGGVVLLLLTRPEVRRWLGQEDRPEGPRPAREDQPKA